MFVNLRRDTHQDLRQAVLRKVYSVLANAAAVLSPITLKKDTRSFL